MRVTLLAGLLLASVASYKIYTSLPSLGSQFDRDLPSSRTSIAGVAVGNDPNKTPLQNEVDSLINSAGVVVFSKSYCGFSRRAKDILGSYLGSDGFKVVELDKRDDGGDIQDYMQDITGGRTVPRVFLGGQFIGGSDDTAQLHASGELKKMLMARGLGKHQRRLFEMLS